MFEHLDYVKAVHECGSFTKAAEQLYVTQPALSLVIRKTEEELGAKLFVRSKKGAVLTEEGELYLRAGQEARRIEQRVRDQMIPDNRGIMGSISIGAAGICMRYVIPEILKELSVEYPGIRIQVVEESYYSLRDQLLREELDLMLDTESYHSQIRHVRLFPNTLFYAVPAALIKDRNLLNRGLSADDIKSESYQGRDSFFINMDDVIDIPFLSLQPRNELYARSEMIFNYYNCRPAALMHFNQQLTAYSFAQHGFGATFVSDTLIKAGPSDKLKYYRFAYDLPERWISIGYKKDRYLTKAMAIFIRKAQEVLGLDKETAKL